MRCGFYEMDITPRLGDNIPGYFVVRPASGIRDPLYCKAAAFEDEAGGAFLLVAMDAIETDGRLTERARARLTELTGIPGEHMMFASTHSHTGGPLDDFVPQTSNDEYRNWLADRAADAAYNAWRRREPAKMAFGSCEERSISFNRRYLMKDGSMRTNPGFTPEAIAAPLGEIDPEVGIMKFVRTDGSLMGVITNFACHLDTVGGNWFCADYPGELSRVLKKVYGEEVVSLFLTGACGNINHYDFMHRPYSYYADANPPHYVRMGRVLAGDVIRALAQMDTFEEAPVVKCACGSFTGNVREPDEESIRAAKELLAAHPYVPVISREGGTSAGDADLVARHYARSLLDVAADPNKTLTIPAQAARVGDVLIAGMPCELFVEFGLDLKARDGFPHTMVSTLTNAHFGYIATREAFDEGGYETTISGDTKMAPRTGYDMVEATLKLAKELA
ncbi:MAG: hypothetical protein Q4C10_13340 [Clostridia bacterium]|nr:hypothetical protein [Clostridia bacterium]